MTTVKVSSLTASTALDDDDILYVVEDGTSKKMTVANLRSTMNGSGVAWIAPTLLNSWVNYGGSEQPAQYRKVGTRVDVRMAVKHGTTSPIFNLPAGYRPTYNLGFSGNVHDNTSAPDYCHIRVLTTGDVQLEHPGSLSNHSVWSTFSFYVD
jgi:hypothetical protein